MIIYYYLYSIILDKMGKGSGANKNKYINEYCKSHNITKSGKNRCISRYSGRKILHLEVNKKIINPSKRGRKHIFSEDDKKKICFILLDNPYEGIDNMIDVVQEETGISCCSKTLRKVARELNLIWAKPLTSIPLSDKNIKLRQQFAKSGNQKFLRNLIYTDECHIQRNNTVMYRQVKGKRDVILQNRWSAEVRIWWAISYNHLFEPIIYTENLTADKYINVLTEFYMANRNKKITSLMLQHDNATCHTSGKTKKFLADKNIKYFDKWPAQSPDLNCIENAWAVIKRRVAMRRPQNPTALRTAIKEVIAAWTIDESRKLIDSMDKRVMLLKEKKGGRIGY